MRDKTCLWCVSENNEEEFDVIHVDNDDKMKRMMN